MNRITTHEISRQNEQVLASGVALHNCVHWLIAHGFTVLRYGYDSRRPVITIQACGQCDILHGVESVTMAPGNKRVRRMVATVQDCQVEWTEAGAH